MFFIGICVVNAGPYDGDQSGCNAGGYQWNTPFWNYGTSPDCCGDDILDEEPFLNSYGNSLFGNQYLCCEDTHTGTSAFIPYGNVSGGDMTSYSNEEIIKWSSGTMWKFVDGSKNGYIRYSGAASPVFVGSATWYYPIAHWKRPSGGDYVFLGKTDWNCHPQVEPCQRDILVLIPSSTPDIDSWTRAWIDLPVQCSPTGDYAPTRMHVTENNKLFVITKSNHGDGNSRRLCVLDLDSFPSTLSGVLYPDFAYSTWPSTEPQSDLVVKWRGGNNYYLYSANANEGEVWRYNVNSLTFSYGGVSFFPSQYIANFDLDYPVGMALDQYGFLYVPDQTAHEILVMDADLNIKQTIPTNIPGYFYNVQDLYFYDNPSNSGNYIYAIDTDSSSLKYPIFSAHSCTGTGGGQPDDTHQPTCFANGHDWVVSSNFVNGSFLDGTYNPQCCGDDIEERLAQYILVSNSSSGWVDSVYNPNAGNFAYNRNVCSGPFGQLTSIECMNNVDEYCCRGYGACMLGGTCYNSGYFSSGVANFLLSVSGESLGKSVCQPVSPWCSKCPVNKYCKKVGVGRSR